MKRAIVIILAFTVSFVSYAMTGEEILKRTDANASFKTIEYEAIMRIHVGKTTRVKTMTAKARGDKDAFMEFTNPEDKGVRYLKTGSELRMYFPDEEEVIKISGHMLKQGIMGSDVSYQDALESDELYAKYAVELTGEEPYNDNACYVLTLVAKSKDAPYDKRVMWIDKKTFICLKEEMYAKSGKLLKEARALETKEIDGRYFAVKTEMEDKLKRNTKTVFELVTVTIDSPIDPSTFTLRALTR